MMNVLYIESNLEYYARVHESSHVHRKSFLKMNLTDITTTTTPPYQPTTVVESYDSNYTISMK